MMNQSRAQAGVAPLSLNQTQSMGTSSCVGSIGHSQAMANSGAIWHDNASYPSASFPNNICVHTFLEGENVAQCAMGDELQGLQCDHNLMMQEPHDPAYCQTYDNHACNIINSSFHSVGIGIVVTGNTVWLTEDLLG